MAQSVLPLRADTVRIEKVGGNGELQIRNATRDSIGVMVNIGGGRTRFMKVKKSGDTAIIIGLDTISITGKVTLQQAINNGNILNKHDTILNPIQLDILGVETPNGRVGAKFMGIDGSLEMVGNGSESFNALIKFRDLTNPSQNSQIGSLDGSNIEAGSFPDPALGQAHFRVAPNGGELTHTLFPKSSIIRANIDSTIIDPGTSSLLGLLIRNLPAGGTADDSVLVITSQDQVKRRAASSFGGGGGSSGIDTITRTPGVDSIYWQKSGNTYSIKDSLGSGELATRGQLYGDTFNGTLSNWTETGTGDFNISGNALEVSDPAGSNGFAKYISYTAYGTTDLKPIQFKWRIIVGTIGATSYCPVAGFQTATGSRNMQWSINTTTDANRGRIQWYYDNSSTVFRYSDGSMTVNSGDTIDVVATLLKGSYSVAFINRTTNEGASVSDWFFLSRNANGYSAGFPIAYTFSIHAMGATIHTIDNVSVESAAPVGADFLDIGDSLVHGSLTSNGDNTHLNHLNKMVKEIWKDYGGPGETVEQINANDVLALSPKKIIISLGTNNLIGLGDNAATFMGKLATLVSSLTSAGYVLGTTLFIRTLPPTNTNDVTSYNNSIISTYGNAVVDVNKALKAFGGTGLSTRYVSSDGIHYSDYAHMAIALYYANFFGLQIKNYYQENNFISTDIEGKLPLGRFNSAAREGLSYADPTGTMRISNNADSTGMFAISNNNWSGRIATNVTWDGAQYIARQNRVSMLTVDSTQFAGSFKSGLTAGNPITFVSTDTKFKFTNTGRFGLNTATPITAVDIREAGGLGLMVTNTLGGSGNAGVIRAQRTVTPTAADWVLGTITGGYTNDPTILTCGALTWYSASAFTDNVSMPTYMAVRLIPPGSNALVERARFTENGSLLLNTTGGTNISSRGFYNNRSAGRNKDSTTKVTATGIHEMLIVDTTTGREHRATIPAGGSGDVAGPASSTDNAIARFDGTTGKIIQNSAATVDDAGNIAASGGVSIANSSVFSWAGRSWLRSFADGNITLSNTLGDDFNMLQFGGIVSGYPALKRSGAGLVVRDAADGGDAALTASVLTQSSLSGTGTRLGTINSSGLGGALANGSDGQFVGMVSGNLAFSAPPNIYTTDGTLAGDRVMSGNNFTLQLGTSASKLSSAAINSAGILQLFGTLQLSSSTATDNDFTIANGEEFITLPTITATRTVTLPSNGAGKMLIIWNKNNSGNSWQFGAGAVNADGTALTSIPNNAFTIMINDGTNWGRVTF